MNMCHRALLKSIHSIKILMCCNDHSLHCFFYPSGSWDVRALDPGRDQRLLPHKCNKQRSPNVSCLGVIFFNTNYVSLYLKNVFTRAAYSVATSVITNALSVNPCSSFTCRPLHIAARNGLATVVQVLLSRGAAVMAVDEEGKQQVKSIVSLYISKMA